MDITTSYAVRLFFSSPSFSQVYFEAVANAIDAGADSIKIDIRTDGNIHSPSFLDVTIADNGEGLTEQRFARFRRIEEPQDAYHKGLGRLVFLNYFDRVDVESVFGEKRRTFAFTKSFVGDCKVESPANDSPSGTTLMFRQFSGERIKSYDDLRPAAIRQLLLEQFLPILHEMKKNGRKLRVEISLTTDAAKPQYEFFSEAVVLTEQDLSPFSDVVLKSDFVDGLSEIEVSYSIQQGVSKPLLLTAACVDGRTIPLKLLSPASVPAGTSAIFLFRSDLFGGRSDSARQRLVLPDGLSESTLFAELKKEVSRILSEAVPAIRERNEATTKAFEENFPHLIGLFDLNTVGLIDRDEALETAQRRFLHAQKSIIDSDPSDEAAFQKSLEFSARSLMEYVLYRDWVIRRLQETKTTDLESVVHELIVPRYHQFEGTSLVEDIYRNNAWILDDRFMTFRTILSEKRMAEVIRAITLEDDPTDDESRPDISMIFSADPDTEQKVDVVVVELKKKQVDDKEGTYASVQLTKRARKLVDFCPNIQRMWYYGVIGIDDELAQLLVDMEWTPLFSMGRVFFQDRTIKRRSDDTPVSTPTFLLSFDAITSDAAARNHAFLELLKDGFRASIKRGEEPASDASGGACTVDSLPPMPVHDPLTTPLGNDT